ncbi:hypothetical protein [Paraliobacillus sediminis]|nr:hypothetical protein [Paraliobacillus sediminis]
MDTLAMVFMVVVAPILFVFAMYQEVMDDEKKACEQKLLDSKEGQ